MNFDLKTLDGTICLAEPHALKRAIAAAVSMPCYSARQVATERYRRMEHAKSAASRAVRAVKGKVGLIAVHGPIQQRCTSELMKAGGTSCDEISAQLDALLTDGGIDAIVLHCDSPGGSSYGVEELSDKIFNARARKPIYASVDSMACSAAYWLCTSAGHVSCTPGGDVGSVGVYTMHIDESESLKAQGLNVTFVSAAKYKTELASTAPLTDDARAYLQESVDETYSKFIDALARNRECSKGDVREKFGQGRVMGADKALAAGMIDAIRTFEQLMQKLTGSSGDGSPAQAASVEMLRLRDAQRRREAWAMLGLASL